MSDLLIPHLQREKARLARMSVDQNEKLILMSQQVQDLEATLIRLGHEKDYFQTEYYSVCREFFPQSMPLPDVVHAMELIQDRLALGRAFALRSLVHFIYKKLRHALLGFKDNQALVLKNLAIENLPRFQIKPLFSSWRDRNIFAFTLYLKIFFNWHSYARICAASRPKNKVTRYRKFLSSAFWKWKQFHAEDVLRSKKMKLSRAWLFLKKCLLLGRHQRVFCDRIVLTTHRWKHQTLKQAYQRILVYGLKRMAQDTWLKNLFRHWRYSQKNNEKLNEFLLRTSKAKTKRNLVLSWASILKSSKTASHLQQRILKKRTSQLWRAWKNLQFIVKKWSKTLNFFNRKSLRHGFRALLLSAPSEDPRISENVSSRNLLARAFQGLVALRRPRFERLPSRATQQVDHRVLYRSTLESYPRRYLTNLTVQQNRSFELSYLPPSYRSYILERSALTEIQVSNQSNSATKKTDHFIIHQSLTADILPHRRSASKINHYHGVILHQHPKARLAINATITVIYLLPPTRSPLVVHQLQCINLKWNYHNTLTIERISSLTILETEFITQSSASCDLETLSSLPFSDREIILPSLEPALLKSSEPIHYSRQNPKPEILHDSLILNKTARNVHPNSLIVDDTDSSLQQQEIEHFPHSYLSTECTISIPRILANSASSLIFNAHGFINNKSVHLPFLLSKLVVTKSVLHRKTIKSVHPHAATFSYWRRIARDHSNFATSVNRWNCKKKRLTPNVFFQTWKLLKEQNTVRRAKFSILLQNVLLRKIFIYWQDYNFSSQRLRYLEKICVIIARPNPKLQSIFIFWRFISSLRKKSKFLSKNIAVSRNGKCLRAWLSICMKKQIASKHANNCKVKKSLENWRGFLKQNLHKKNQELFSKTFRRIRGLKLEFRLFSWYFPRRNRRLRGCERLRDLLSRFLGNHGVFHRLTLNSVTVFSEHRMALLHAAQELSALRLSFALWKSYLPLRNDRKRTLIGFYRKRALTSAFVGFSKPRKLKRGILVLIDTVNRAVLRLLNFFIKKVIITMGPVLLEEKLFLAEQAKVGELAKRLLVTWRFSTLQAKWQRHTNSVSTAARNLQVLRTQIKAAMKKNKPAQLVL